MMGIQYRIVLFAFIISQVQAFTVRPLPSTITTAKYYHYDSQRSQSVLSATSDDIALQSDSSQFGRGEMHLSAMLEEGDVIAYQVGGWLVDGVWVGDDDSDTPQVMLATVDTIQVVWTHNCEHGVIRGIAMATTEDQPNQSIQMLEPIEFVELGPEQLLARLPVKWETEEATNGNFQKPIDLLDLIQKMPADED